VLSIDEYHRLIEAKPSLRDHLPGGPRVGASKSNDRRIAIDELICELPPRNQRGVGDLTLVTRNTRDLARTGVRLLNPWDAE
jgi:hypothetical protein